MHLRRFFSVVALAFVATVSFGAYVVFADSESEKVERTDTCGFEMPEEEVYSADFIAVRRPLVVEEGEEFRVKAFIKNTGTFPWFSGDSNCPGPHMSLGTDKERDHASVFYDEDGNWEADNRVKMDQLRVDPGEIASFTFYVDPGKDTDVLKEYFTPVLEDLAWIDDAGFSVDVIIGEPEVEKTTLRKMMMYAGSSGSVLEINLNAEKKFVVDLSDQNMKMMLGDTVVKDITVSTGAPSTPTPVGEFEIMLKQDVRVGSAAPHYIMPRFMMFRSGGYGFHALPSLSTDGGTFWTEARDHIGIPVSHGCVRMLPEDADFAYEFADVGMKVIIQK